MNAAEIEKRAFSKEELDKINGYTEEVNGLNDLSVDDNVKEVKLPVNLTPQTLTEMYFALPIRYRHTATWVILD